jgi:hypothetical protein
MKPAKAELDMHIEITIVFTDVFKRLLINKQNDSTRVVTKLCEFCL